MKNNGVFPMAGMDFDRERLADWATALVPVLVISVLYYRWAAVALMVTAVAGYAAAARLLAWVLKRETTCDGWAALVYGVLAVCWLPAAAPWWLSALVGGLAALMATVVSVTRRIGLCIHPAVSAVAVVRALFPSVFLSYTVPEQFVPVERVAAVTPLTALMAGEALPEWWKLLFGVHAAAVGDGCAAAILLGAVYLLLRRRLRMMIPCCLLAAVVVTTWLFGVPLMTAVYMPLLGGVLLGAWLCADQAYAPVLLRDQAAVGVVAGAVTVFVLLFTNWQNGVLLGVLAGQILMPALPYIYHGLAVFWRWIRPFCRRGGRAIASQIQQLIKKEK